MEMSLDPYELYYMFIDFDVLRVGTRLPVGEMEDITFTISNFVVSQNVLLVKILELKCREIELEHYIDEMLGVRVEDMNLDEILTADFPQFKEGKGLGEYNKFVKGLRDTSDAYTGFLKKVKTPKIKNLMFLKHGKYERDFKDRITKDYLKIAGRIYAGIVGFIKTQMGVG
jgi:hypothetical protein